MKSLLSNLICVAEEPVKLEDLNSGCFIASTYDNLWYFDMVKEVNNEEKDVSFMHPNRPSPSFFLPEREDSMPFLFLMPS